MKVTLPYDDNWAALTWAKKNCPSYITNATTRVVIDVVSMYPYENVVNYYFGDEKDANWFALRWAQNT